MAWCFQSPEVVYKVYQRLWRRAQREPDPEKALQLPHVEFVWEVFADLALALPDSFPIEPLKGERHERDGENHE
jgi:hypothetical protein